MGCGTDANVYIQLFGEDNDSGIIELKSSNNRNKWERDQNDEFTIESVGLGDLKKIRIGHDNAGFKPGWYVKSSIFQFRFQCRITVNTAV